MPLSAFIPWPFPAREGMEMLTLLAYASAPTPWSGKRVKMKSRGSPVGLLLTQEVNGGDPVSGVRGGVVEIDETDSTEVEKDEEEEEEDVLLDELEEPLEHEEDRRGPGIGTAEVARGLEAE